MRGMLSPSLMCADPLNVQQELTVLDDLGVDYIHLDFMDNHFVPNLTLSPELIKATKKVLRHMKRDIHIMAVEPQQYFDRMDIGEGDIVAVHYEACPDLGAVLADIRQRGATPAIALSPDTEPEVLTEWLGKIGMVLVMTVYPGFAGRPIVPGSMEKLAAVRKLIDKAAIVRCSRWTVTSAGSCAVRCAPAEPICLWQAPPRSIRRVWTSVRRSPE